MWLLVSGYVKMTADWATTTDDTDSVWLYDYLACNVYNSGTVHDCVVSNLKA